jgi:cytochrome c1
MVNAQVKTDRANNLVKCFIGYLLKVKLQKFMQVYVNDSLAKHLQGRGVTANMASGFNILRTERPSHMTILASLMRQLENPSLSRTGRVELCCQIAYQLEDVGDYQSAAEALAEFWPGLASVRRSKG